MRKLFALALCGLGLLALGSSAQAAPIAGEIHFAGLWNPTGGSGTATATGLDFTTSGYQVVLDGAGDYTGLRGTAVVFENFTFAPFGGPVVPLWSFSSGGVDYSFELRSLAVPTPTSQDSTQIGLRGSGVLHITDNDLTDGDSSRTDTVADWDFTGNSGGVLFSFSADNVAVPEATTVGLLGLGLIGLVGAGSKKARRSA